jgi:NAD(P)H dehydrogenase (quinone)
MTRILVLYYSSYGHVRAVWPRPKLKARAACAGTHRRSCAACPRPCHMSIRAEAPRFYVEDDTPVATPADLERLRRASSSAPPRCFGMMAGQMKQSFLDQAGGLWARNALVGKVAAVFASTGSQHGGHEATLLTFQIPLHAFRDADRRACPTASPVRPRADEYRWRRALWGGHHRRGRRIVAVRQQTDLAGARFQGAHVARIAARLAARRPCHEEAA